jgi:DNA-binding NarL/FixJ family response regulator
MLTGREHEVLQLVAHGMRTRAIAVHLGIAETTVLTFIRTARSKLGARNRTQAALLAAQRPPATVPANALEPDHRRLLAFLAGGATVDEAAGELHVSRRTAQRWLAEIRSNLGVETTAAAVVRGAPEQVGVRPQEPERERG